MALAAEAVASPLVLDGEAVPPSRPGPSEVVLVDTRVVEVMAEEADDSKLLAAAKESVVVLWTTEVVDVTWIDTSEGVADGSAVVPASEGAENWPATAVDTASSPTLGQSFSTAIPLKNIPIRVSGYAVMPLHSSLSSFVLSSRKATHCGEHVAPL